MDPIMFRFFFDSHEGVFQNNQKNIGDDRYRKEYESYEKNEPPDKIYTGNISKCITHFITMHQPKQSERPICRILKPKWLPKKSNA